MTERQWLSSNDPAAMLSFLLGDGAHYAATQEHGPLEVVTRRKLRLLACATCYQAGGRLGQKARALIEVAERHADGKARFNERGKAFNVAENMASPTQGSLAMGCLRLDISVGVLDVCHTIGEWVPLSLQANLIRDVFGNPHVFTGRGQPWLGIAALSALTPQVWSLATAAYEEVRPDGTLESDRLHVLADALEEAGCDNTDILWHLHIADGDGIIPCGPHARGCWALDCVLGKG